ncbi:MAG: hypothetical protein LBP21_02655 [Synergistaceae bacterium]|jgi:hypothetical protein|nr:hypothetical protein [Synergistaceae bacterium]
MWVQFKKILLFTLAVFFTVCPSAAFSEEVDFTVTSQLMSPSKNAAGLIFLATPATEAFTEQQKVAADHALIWAYEIPKIDGSESRFFTEGTHQLSNESGFSFAIQTTGESAGKSAIVGLNALFYFTPENLGQEKYDAMLAKLEAAENYEGWCVASPILADLRLSVNCRYPDGSQRDITSVITAFISIGEKDSEKLLLSYGAVIADRAVTDKEGEELFLSDETEVLLSDGKHDDVITGTWWIADKSSSGEKSGGGCNGVTSGMLVSLIAAAAVMKIRQKLG